MADQRFETEMNRSEEHRLYSSYPGLHPSPGVGQPQLHSTSTTTPQLPISKDHTAITVASERSIDIIPVVQTVAEALTTAFEVSRPQGGSNNEVSQGIGQTNEPEEPHPPTNDHANLNLIRALWIIALFTYLLAIITACRKQARKVVFAGNNVAYCIALAVVFISGIAAAFAACYLSRRPRDTNRRRFSLGRIVLFVTIWPFGAICAVCILAFTEG